MKSLRITTAELAKICNVSQGTVDRALNDRTDIKAQTKQNILETAKKYGYRKSIDTQSGSITGQVGIIVFNLNNEFFCDLITEIEYALRKKNLGVVVMLSHYDKEAEIEAIRSLYNMGVEGIVLCSVNSGREFKNYLSMFDIPIVAVGNRVEGIPYVGIDDFSAMREMTLKVISEEYQNVIYFSPALRYSDAFAQRSRYEGFLNAVGERTFDVVTHIDDIKKHYGEKTVVICSSDYYALQVYFKAADIKITGFDNISSLKKYKTGISTVDYSRGEIASSIKKIICEGIRKDFLVNHVILDN